MNRNDDLPDGLFNVDQAKAAGISRRRLQTLESKGEIERIARGVYQHKNYDENPAFDTWKSAFLRVGEPCAICLFSALEYHGVNEELQRGRVWILVQNGRKIEQEGVTIRGALHPHWEIGIEKTKDFWVTDIDRTLAEAIAYRERADWLPLDVSKAVREAFERELTYPAKVLKMADKLGLSRRVKPYLEIFI